MKKIISVALMCCAAFGAIAGFQAEVLKFNKSNHDFGNVKEKEPVTAEFTFTNISTVPVIIEDATAECGCTKPEFPPRPIPPGKTGTIKVTYDSKTLGVFTKKVTVKLVNIQKPYELTITGIVVS